MSTQVEEQTETQSLEILDEVTAIQVFDGDKLEPILTKIEEHALSLAPDISSAKGRDEIRSNAHKVTRCKTHLDNLGKEANEERNRLNKLVNEKRQLLRERLTDLAAKVRKPLTDWEEKEANRVKAHEQKLEDIKLTTANLRTLNLEGARERLDWLNKQVVDEAWEEFEYEASRVYNEAHQELTTYIAELEEQARKDAELKRLQEAEKIRKEEEAKKEAVDKEIATLRSYGNIVDGTNALALSNDLEYLRGYKIDADKFGLRIGEAEQARELSEMKLKERIRILKEEEAAAEKVRQEELAKIAEIQRKENEKAEADRIKAAEEAAAKRERDRIEAEQKAKDDEARKAREKAEAKAASEKHRSKVRAAAAEGLRAWGMDSAEAANLVLAVERGEIPHLSVNF